jgi:hypothetical protein
MVSKFNQAFEMKKKGSAAAFGAMRRPGGLFSFGSVFRRGEWLLIPKSPIAA